MKIFKYIILLLLMEACTKPKNKTTLISNSDFFHTIDTYIKKNPLKPCYQNIDNKKFSYPSYNIYFNKVDNDTVMSIIRSSTICNFELDGTQSLDNKDIIFYRIIKLDGVIWYKDKYALALFNSKLYTKENLIGYLTQDIPDSLELNQPICHIKPNRKDYIIKHQKIKEFNNCQPQKNNKEFTTYTIKKNLIESVDVHNDRIKLNKKGVKLLSKLDFSKFSSIRFDPYGCKIILIPSVMSFRPPDVFVNIEGKTIIESNIIQIQTKHLEEDNSSLVDLKLTLNKISH